MKRAIKLIYINFTIQMKLKKVFIAFDNLRNINLTNVF